MDQPTLRMALPKPRGATRVLMFVLGGLGVANAVLMNWGESATLFRWLVLLPEALPLQVHRFVSSLLLTSPQSYSHVLFALLLLFFFGPAVEAQVGTKKFLALFFGGGVLGSLFGLLGNLTGIARLSSPFFYGPNAALEALIVAWSLHNARATVQMFFVLPMRGSWMKWISLAFCALGLLYPNAPPEGALAGFGGFSIGLLFGGQPSLVRSLFLRNKLQRLEDQKQRLRKEGPPLRVVYGGLADELGLDKKRRGDKPDKRTLN